MPYYQLYFVNEQGARTVKFEFSANDDDTAQICAQDFRGRDRAELWRGTQWVNAWPANGNRQRGALSGWARRRKSG